jgi:hypothetical protein
MADISSRPGSPVTAMGSPVTAMAIVTAEPSLPRG